MKKMCYFFCFALIMFISNTLIAQTAHKIAIQFYASATNLGAVSIYADTINEGQIYTIKQETLPSSYSLAQPIYNALVGSEFYFESGSLNQDITIWFVISDIDLSSGKYSANHGANFFLD